MSVRILESPSVGWARREREKFDKGQRKTMPEAFSGKVLGLAVVDGVLSLSEEKVHSVTRADGSTYEEPLWHVFVQDLHFRDVTPEDQPPVFPLPGRKPYRGTIHAKPTGDAAVRTRAVLRTSTDRV